MIGKQYEYDRMAACEKELWWYRSLHATTLEKIKKYASSANPSILDAGCGTGGMLSILHNNGYRHCKGFDLSDDAVSHTLTTYGFAVQPLDILRAGEAYPADSFDIIISNDVLCLLPEPRPREALSQLLSLLRPGGFLLMNLPAGKAFSGTHDIAVGIQKRYSKKTVRQLVGECALVKELTYWPFLLSPLILAARFFQRLRLLFVKDPVIVSDVSLPPSLINQFFYRLTQFENQVLRHKPWGSSLFIVLQKA